MQSDASTKRKRQEAVQAILVRNAHIIHALHALQRTRTDPRPGSEELALAQEAKQNMVSLALCHAPNDIAGPAKRVKTLVSTIHAMGLLPSKQAAPVVTPQLQPQTDGVLAAGFGRCTNHGHSSISSTPADASRLTSSAALEQQLTTAERLTTPLPSPSQQVHDYQRANEPTVDRHPATQGQQTTRLNAVQEANLFKMLSIANQIAPGSCAPAQLTQHAARTTQPMGPAEFQHFGLMMATYRKQQLRRQLQQQQQQQQQNSQEAQQQDIMKVGQEQPNGPGQMHLQANVLQRRHSQGLGSQSQGPALQSQGMGLQSQGLGLQPQGMGLQSQGMGLQPQGMGLQSPGLGLQSQGMGLQSQGSAQSLPRMRRAASVEASGFPQLQHPENKVAPPRHGSEHRLQRKNQTNQMDVSAGAHLQIAAAPDPQQNPEQGRVPSGLEQQHQDSMLSAQQKQHRPGSQTLSSSADQSLFSKPARTSPQPASISERLDLHALHIHPPDLHQQYGHRLLSQSQPSLQQGQRQQSQSPWPCFERTLSNSKQTQQPQPQGKQGIGQQGVGQQGSQQGIGQQGIGQQGFRLQTTRQQDNAQRPSAADGLPVSSGSTLGSPTLMNRPARSVSAEMHAIQRQLLSQRQQKSSVEGMLQSNASAGGFRARGGARDLLSQAHEHEHDAQGSPQGGTHGSTQGRTQGGDQRFTQQQRSSSGGTHMGDQEGLARTALSCPLTEQGLSLGAVGPQEATPKLGQQQSGGAQQQTHPHRRSPQTEEQKVAQGAQPSSNTPAAPSQVMHLRQPLPRPLPLGLLQVGQPQAGELYSGAEQLSEPWMQTLAGMQAPDHHLAKQARPVQNALQAQHAQQAQQAQHAQHAQHAQQAQQTQQTQHAQHAFRRSESSSPHQPSAGDRSMLPLQSEALDSNRSLTPSSQFSAVQQAQEWIAQQQHQRKQQHQQPRLFDSESEHAVGAGGLNRSASGLSGSTAGNSKPGTNASAEETQRALLAAQHASATQSLEGRSNSTEAIWEAQRKTMAFLAARDPKRPPWGQMGDPAVDNTRPVTRQSPSLPSTQPPSWGQVGMGTQPGRGLTAVPAAPSSSFGGPSPGSPKLPQSPAPWTASMTELPFASSSDQMQSQELMNAVKVKGALHVQGIQKLLQQQASSSQQPRHKVVEQETTSLVASDESDAWTSSSSGLSEEEDQNQSCPQGHHPSQEQEEHLSYSQGHHQNPSQEEEQNVVTRSSSNHRSGSPPAHSTPLAQAKTNPSPAAALAPAPAPAAAAVAAAAAADAAQPGSTHARPTSDSATEGHAHHPDFALAATTAQHVPCGALSGSFTSSGALSDTHGPTEGLAGSFGAAGQLPMAAPPSSEDIALLQKQLQQLHSRQTQQLQDRPHQQQQQQSQAQQQQHQAESSDLDRRSSGAFDRPWSQPGLVQAGKPGQLEFSVPSNGPGVELDCPQLPQQRWEGERRGSGTPQPATQQQALPRADMHTSRSPSPRAVGHICSAQGRGAASEGRSPAVQSSRETPFAGSGAQGSPGAQPVPSPSPQQNPGSGRASPLHRTSASPAPQPWPAVAGNNRASPGPAARASAGPETGLSADAGRASPPLKTSSPSQSRSVSGSGIRLPHSRASPAFQYSMAPSSEAALLYMQDRPTSQVRTGASPPSHAEQSHPQPASGQRASPSLQTAVRASPSPHAEQSQPQPEVQHSALPHADPRASPAAHAENPLPLPQPALQHKASPERSRALPHAQNKTPSPVAQMMVVASQLKPPPQLAALAADQVSTQAAEEK